MRLTPTSFIVLGLVRWTPGISAYELEQIVTSTVSHMWTIQRSQIYKEPGRLAEAGLLVAEDDRRGRVAKTRYTIAEPGAAALDEWLGARVQQTHEVRDLALLKIFFGASPAALAQDQLDAHRARLGGYQMLCAAGMLAPPGPRTALEAAIAHEETAIRFWTELLARDR